MDAIRVLLLVYAAHFIPKCKEAIFDSQSNYIQLCLILKFSNTLHTSKQNYDCALVMHCKHTLRSQLNINRLTIIANCSRKNPASVYLFKLYCTRNQMNINRLNNNANCSGKNLCQCIYSSNYTAHDPQESNGT